MAGLESFRWMMWYMNICGMTPLRMEVNHKTKKFERVSFSYCSISTWWFFTLIIIQLVLSVLIGSKVAIAFFHFLTNVPPLTIFTLTLQFVSSGIILNTPRLILFYYNKLAECANYQKKFDNIIDQFGQWPCTSKLRTVLGIFGVILTSVGFFFSATPVFKTCLSDIGGGYFYGLAVFMLFPLSHVGGLHLLLHLNYYTLAHRLEVIISLLANRKLNSTNLTAIGPEHVEHSPWNTKSLGEQLKTLKYLYYCLSRAAKRLNSSFSLIIWLIVTIKVVTLTTALFLFISTVIHGSLGQFTASNISSIALDVTTLLTIFHAVDMPVNKVDDLKLELLKISNQPLTESEKLELISFETQISEEHFRVTAGGQFQVGQHLIPSLAGAVLTYLIILLQTAFHVGD